MVAQLISDTLLFLGVAVLVVGVLATLVVRTSYDRLHLLGLVSLLAAPLIGAALVLIQGRSEDAIKTVLTVVVLMLCSPVVSHALGRAIRVQRSGSVAQPRRSANHEPVEYR
ncbi:MAG: monovalent cation/H(+) antiporter subunit G [Candidatus Dormibacteria bacterium]